MKCLLHARLEDLRSLCISWPRMPLLCLSKQHSRPRSDTIPTAEIKNVNMAPKNFEDARRHIEALFNHQFKNPVFLHEALNGADATFTADHLVTEPTIKLALLGETAVELITLSGECKDPTKSSRKSLSISIETF